MGTPDYAAVSLRALIRAGHEVAAVVTQPDKPKGRSDKLLPPPVKEAALEYGIPVLQPKRIRKPEAVEELRKYPADVFVVAAFGQILPKEVLEMPKLGCINIHASLLPKYRGAAPIQWSILNGERETGITIMQMGEKIDDGDILFQKRIPILPTDTGDTLFDKLTALGAECIVEALPKLEAGELTPTPQDEEQATHVGKIEKSMGKLDFSKSAEELARQIRALNSWPSSFCSYQGRQLKIWEAVPASPEETADAQRGLAPGSIVLIGKEYFLVQTGDGFLKVKTVQLEGKKRMSVKDFLLGVKMKETEVLR